MIVLKTTHDFSNIYGSSATTPLLRPLVAVLTVFSSVFAVLATKQNDVVPGNYIVTLKTGVQIQQHLSWASQVHARSSRRRDTDTGVGHQYAIQDFNAYAASFDDDTIEQIRKSEEVSLVEPSTYWGFFQTESQPDLITQSNAPWGLSSISHKQGPSSDYIYDPLGGTDMYAYIIDTGLTTSLAEFEGRAAFAYNAVTGSTTADNIGHGTHVAGTVASKTYGVAKAADLVSMKVLDAVIGQDTKVMAGYNWAVENITAEGREANSVISMSLGGRYLQAFNAMIEAAYQVGITTVVAAGNSGADANLTSPASAPNAITVGAIAANFTKPTWSNYGSVVDIFAPGVGTLSTWPTGNLTQTLSGTSMSVPHVAGLVLYLNSIMPGLESPGESWSRDSQNKGAGNTRFGAKFW